MANCNAEFQAFLDNIQLTKTKVGYLRQSRDAIRNKIENYYEEKNLKAPNFCGQGSFKVKTGITQSGEDYDIDDGVYLRHLPDEKADWPETELLHKEIISAVDGHTDTPPEDKSSCVRVQYKKEYHVDLAIYGEYDGKIYLAKKGKEQWEENNPKLFTEWFHDKLKLHGEQFRSVCKYVKKWAYYNGWTDTISGFLITILMGNHFNGSNDRDDIALSETLKAIVTDLESNRKVLRPVKPYKNMTESMSESDMDSMIKHFKSFRDSARNAVSVESKEEAQKTWQQLFGDDFPKYQGQQSHTASKTHIIRENKPWGN